MPVGIVARDLDGRRGEELLLAWNLPARNILGNAPGVSRAEVRGLRRDRSGFASLGTVEGIEGCITGLGLADADGDGAEDLLVGLSVKRAALPLSGTRGELRIYFRR
jgi:hypothetical protein